LALWLAFAGAEYLQPMPMLPQAQSTLCPQAEAFS
jgi:hypothetical protein